MWLTIAGLVIAGGSALYGIWSAKDVEYVTAGIASALTVAGIVVGLVTAWNDRSESLTSARLAEERHSQIVADLETQRQDAVSRERTALAQFKALRTSLPLYNLEIVWDIPDAPEALKDAIYLADGMFESYAVRDDEFRRMLSRNERDEVRASFAVDDAIGPVLAALADGSMNVHQFYNGQVDEAARLYRDLPAGFDPLEGPAIDRSTEIDPVLLLPLNVSISGVLSLGRKADDPRPQNYRQNPGNYDAIINDLLTARSFGFSATATDLGDKGLELRFVYDRKSLEQASRLSPGQTMTMAWPDEFNMIIVTKGLPPGEDDLSLLKEMQPRDDFKQPFSTLTLIPNGLKDAAIEFDVQRGVGGSLTTDYSTYYENDNSTLFEYTTFHVRKRISQE